MVVLICRSDSKKVQCLSLFLTRDGSPAGPAGSCRRSLLSRPDTGSLSFQGIGNFPQPQFLQPL
jgi:hypothetical protein